MILLALMTFATFQIHVDVSQTPDANQYAVGAKALCEEWYPKIEAILFGEDHPLPFPEINLVFEPSLHFGKDEVPAYANANAIHVSAGYLTRIPDDYRGMMIHELTHVNQNYRTAPKNGGWVVEGIADYVRHKYFEKDIVTKLRLNATGQLTGYSQTEPFFFSLENGKVKLVRKGYRLSYTVASTFLYWLELRKDKDIVRKLNAALWDGRYSPRLFQQHCGARLDALWREFIAESRRG